MIYQYVLCFDQERERNLVTVKLDKIVETVNATLRAHDSSFSQQFTISEGTRCMIMEELFNAIDSWRGNKLNRIKESPSSFRAYFKTGKNRWDSAKNNYLATALWIRIFSIINQVWSLLLFRSRVSYVMWFHISCNMNLNRP